MQWRLSRLHGHETVVLVRVFAQNRSQFQRVDHSQSDQRLQLESQLSELLTYHAGTFGRSLAFQQLVGGLLKAEDPRFATFQLGAKLQEATVFRIDRLTGRRQVDRFRCLDLTFVLLQPLAQLVNDVVELLVLEHLELNCLYFERKVRQLTSMRALCNCIPHWSAFLQITSHFLLSPSSRFLSSSARLVSSV